MYMPTRPGTTGTNCSFCLVNVLYSSRVMATLQGPRRPRPTRCGLAAHYGRSCGLCGIRGDGPGRGGRPQRRTLLLHRAVRSSLLRHSSTGDNVAVVAGDGVTVAREVEHEDVVEGSRFIARVRPVSSVAEA